MSVYKISKMKKEEIPRLIEIWRNQYLKYCNSTVTLDFLSGGENNIVMYLENQIRHGNAIVLKKTMILQDILLGCILTFIMKNQPFVPL